MSKLSVNLNTARQNKNDEFYTLYADVEKAMKLCKKQFEGKVVYCNCDNPDKSNFYKFFVDNFHTYKLKKLVSTYFVFQDIIEGWETYKTEYDGTNTFKTRLNGNGDFRSQESIEILKEADIVCTNPPFSLFREFFAQLIKYNKKFIILGNLVAISYKEVFQVFLNGGVWTGESIRSSGAKFTTPEPNKIAKVAVRWFTNVETDEGIKKNVVLKDYHKNDYDFYDNYNAISVDKISQVPNYDGLIGVPVTFVDVYNPEQFEIVDIKRELSVKGMMKFSRFIIKNKTYSVQPIKLFL